MEKVNLEDVIVPVLSYDLFMHLWLGMKEILQDQVHDVKIFMSRKANSLRLLFSDIMKNDGIEPRNLIISDHEIDHYLTELKTGKVLIIDDTILYGTSVTRLVRKLVNGYGLSIDNISIYAFAVRENLFNDDKSKYNREKGFINITNNRMFFPCRDGSNDEFEVKAFGELQSFDTASMSCISSKLIKALIASNTPYVSYCPVYTIEFDSVNRVFDNYPQKPSDVSYDLLSDNIKKIFPRKCYSVSTFDIQAKLGSVSFCLVLEPLSPYETFAAIKFCVNFKMMETSITPYVIATSIPNEFIGERGIALQEYTFQRCRSLVEMFFDEVGFSRTNVSPSRIDKFNSLKNIPSPMIRRLPLKPANCDVNNYNGQFENIFKYIVNYFEELQDLSYDVPRKTIAYVDVVTFISELRKKFNEISESQLYVILSSVFDYGCVSICDDCKLRAGENVVRAFADVGDGLLYCVSTLHSIFSERWVKHKDIIFRCIEQFADKNRDIVNIGRLDDFKKRQFPEIYSTKVIDELDGPDKYFFIGLTYAYEEYVKRNGSASEVTYDDFVSYVKTIHFEDTEKYICERELNKYICQ